MSYAIGIDTINLRPTPRIGHTECCTHDRLMATVCAAAGGCNFADAWDFDLILNTHDGPRDWFACGRATDMGHAAFREDGRDMRPAVPSPFRNVDEVLAFDAVAEYGLEAMDTLTRFYEECHTRNQMANPGQVFTGGYYKSIISGAIQSFGWEYLLEAAADQRAFIKVLDSFHRYTMHHIRAWAGTSAPVFLSHDDMVWTAGPFMHPDIYRHEIFPRYREQWAVLKKAGKKVLFAADGNWTGFIDDIAAAGADGFVFEPLTDLDRVVERHGATHVIVSGKVDSRTLALGTLNQIKAEVDATISLARRCPGFIATVGNHIPGNIPVANALFYFNYLRANWSR